MSLDLATCSLAPWYSGDSIGYSVWRVANGQSGIIWKNLSPYEANTEFEYTVQRDTEDISAERTTRDVRFPKNM